jgi:hypothetical protein
MSWIEKVLLIGALLCLVVATNILYYVWFLPWVVVR